MYIGYIMSKQDWKELMEELKNTNGITITSYPETDNEGYFVDFKYVTFEYDNIFFYMQEDLINNFEITAYQKVNPYEKRQISYPQQVRNFEDIVKYINEPRVIRPFAGTHNQRIYLTELYGLKDGKTTLWRLKNELSGYREKDIIVSLDRIEMTMNTKDYKVLRFWHSNGSEYFDYECKSKRITG